MVEVRVVRSLFGKKRFIFEQGGFITAHRNMSYGLVRIMPERFLLPYLHFPESRERFVGKTKEFLGKAVETLDRVILGEKPKPEFRGALL